ncbi:MAG: hypothetical protein DI601_00230 [Azospirillum brasilense]|nr:MAG: hypothetical protein DI601_00230 [Azospirillum brasilense]
MMRGERADTMAVAGGVTGGMALVGGLLISSAMAARDARQQAHHDDWASHWARRAAAAERELATARGQAISYRAQWSDAEDRAALLAEENTRLRARIAALV